MFLTEMFSFVVTGTEEARPGQRGGPACVRGSSRVSDSPEFGSFVMEAVSAAGKRTHTTVSTLFYTGMHRYYTGMQRITGLSVAVMQEI